MLAQALQTVPRRTHNSASVGGSIRTAYGALASHARSS